MHLNNKQFTFRANCNVRYFTLNTLCHIVYYNLIQFSSKIFLRVNSVTGKHAVAVTNLSYKML